VTLKYLSIGIPAWQCSWSEWEDTHKCSTAADKCDSCI